MNTESLLAYALSAVFGSTLLLALISGRYVASFTVGLLSLVMIYVYLGAANQQREQAEGFCSAAAADAAVVAAPVDAWESRKRPAWQNPFGNLNFVDILQNPLRPAAADWFVHRKAVEDALVETAARLDPNTMIETFRDPMEKLQWLHTQRHFYSMPCTTATSDQPLRAEYLGEKKVHSIKERRVLGPTRIPPAFYPQG
jgi:hypothetical protein